MKPRQDLEVLARFPLFPTRRTPSSYDTCFRHHPDHPEIEALDPLLDGRSSRLTHTDTLKAITERGPLLASVRCRRQSRCPSLIIVSTTSAHRATRDANEEKWCVRARSFSRRICTSFWAPLEGPEMGIIGASCCGRSGCSKATRQCLRFPLPPCLCSQHCLTGSLFCINGPQSLALFSTF